MEIEVLFPTLIGLAQADQATIAAIDAEVLRQEATLKNLLSYSWGDNVLSSFGQHQDVFACAQLRALQRFVEENVMHFVGKTRQNHQLVIDPAATQSWLNVTRKFGFQERHNHERSVEGLPISGVYYFRTNEQDGDLAIFPSDIQYKLFGNHDIAPKVGKLVLFRSEVFHRVSPRAVDFS